MTTQAVQLRPRPGRGPRSAPAPWFHIVPGTPSAVLVVDRSTIATLDPGLAHALETGDPAAEAELFAAFPPQPGRAVEELGELPPLRAISLNVAQTCNLTCDYCYADEGRFHQPAQTMPLEVAHRAVDDLLAGAPAGDRVTVGFIGGEPLLARPVVHAVVERATARARAAGIGIGFSITTNATTITAADVELFRHHPFAVTVSIDGAPEVHDRHRRRRSGAGSHDEARERLAPLLADPGTAHVTARATICRDDLRIAARVAHLIGLGFHEVGVSPARTAPDPSLVLRGADWEAYHRAMVEAADEEVARVEAGGSGGWRFSNLANALREIGAGSVKSLPCGAAHGYASVAADGALSTCHRTVGDARFVIGAPGAVDDGARRTFLADRLVHQQEPCRTCWARHLCGGGCHAEVDEVGREGCDGIRAWLDHCIRLFVDLQDRRPDLLPTLRGGR